MQKSIALCMHSTSDKTLGSEKRTAMHLKLFLVKYALDQS